VLPVPRRVRNRVCRVATNLNLKETIQPALRVLGVALVLAWVDGLSYLQSLLKSEKHIPPHLRHQDLYVKEREYQTERNLYLAGFCLTLIFVIGRITDLMDEHVALEDELEQARISSPAEAVEPHGEGIEMKSFEMKSPRLKKCE